MLRHHLFRVDEDIDGHMFFETGPPLGSCRRSRRWAILVGVLKSEKLTWQATIFTSSELVTATSMSASWAPAAKDVRAAGHAFDGLDIESVPEFPEPVTVGVYEGDVKILAGQVLRQRPHPPLG